MSFDNLLHDKFCDNGGTLKVLAGRETDVTEAAIRIENVSHAYTRPDGSTVETLNNVSLDIRKGELLGLIGPSGCGKSTLLNIIGGLVTQTSGDVKIGDTPIRGPSPKKVAFVFQDNTLFPWNTILDNVKVALEFQGVPQGSAKSARWKRLKRSASRNSRTTIRINSRAA